MHRIPGKEGKSHRVKIILQYVQSVEKGELPHNHEIMRQVISFSKVPYVLSDSVFFFMHRSVPLCSLQFPIDF
jgi:hypothetical protein